MEIIYRELMGAYATAGIRYSIRYQRNDEGSGHRASRSTPFIREIFLVRRFQVEGSLKGPLNRTPVRISPATSIVR